MTGSIIDVSIHDNKMYVHLHLHTCLAYACLLSSVGQTDIEHPAQLGSIHSIKTHTELLCSQAGRLPRPACCGGCGRCNHGQPQDKVPTRRRTREPEPEREVGIGMQHDNVFTRSWGCTNTDQECMRITMGVLPAMGGDFVAGVDLPDL
jgi:hypothetical protein